MRGAAALLAGLLGCAPAAGTGPNPPMPSVVPSVTASSDPGASASATASTGGATSGAAPIALTFESQPIAGVRIGSDQPSVTFAGDKLFVAEGSGWAELCDVTKWKSAMPLPGGLSGWTGARDGTALAAQNDEDRTVLVDPTTGAERGTFATGRGTVTLSPDGTGLVVVRATGFDKFRASVWSAAPGKAGPPRHLDGAQRVPGTIGAVLADGKLAALATAEGGPALYAEGRGAALAGFDSPTRFTFAPDATAAVMCGLKESRVVVAVVDPVTGKERVRFEVAAASAGPAAAAPAATLAGAASGAPGATPPADDATQAYVHSVAASAGAARVAVLVGPAKGPGAVVVADGVTGAIVARADQAAGEGLESSSIAISPDGKYLIWTRKDGPAPASGAKDARKFVLSRAALP